MEKQVGGIGTNREVVAADGRRYAFADHHCFACGTTNPIGMGLHIEFGEGTARAAWTVGDDYVGWSDKAHGGIIATLLDEVMAWAPSSFDSWAVTAEMTIRYRSPASPGEELVATGEVVERRRRIYQVRGEVRASDGRLVAEGSGRYLGATPSQKAALKERYGAAPGTGGE
ncbi:MAG TPA: PaaI family thioesterase [Candidatus Angelobacter sp.]|nr:PaaI family thioesterase [Candidatus Angelobacter sp.]